MFRLEYFDRLMTVLYNQSFVAYYKDQKYAVNENSSLRIVASVHYNAYIIYDIVLAVIQQRYSSSTTTFIN